MKSKWCEILTVVRQVSQPTLLCPHRLVPVKTGVGVRIEKIGGNALDICPGLCHHIISVKL